MSTVRNEIHRSYTNAIDARKLAEQLRGEAFRAARAADEATERFTLAASLANRAKADYEMRFPELIGLGSL